MSRSTPLVRALACAFLCASAVVAAAPPGSPSPAKPSSSASAPAPSGRPSSSASAPTSSGKPSSSASAPARSALTPAAATTGATKKAATKTSPPKPKPKTELQELDWRDLLPETDRKKYNPNAPAPVHGPLGEGGPPAVQEVTTSVNQELDQALVKLPGFIVPIGTPKDGVVREFYLVPYIGEDIHVPPPPSNQMVYVRSTAGVATDAVHEAYWVTGKIHVETRTTPLGTSAYSLVANKVEQYQY